MQKPAPQPIDRLLAIMARLRDPQDGCEWDRAQTFATIAPYTIEEAYEVADAIERNDLDELKSELGDLLLQVVFHSRMAEEAGLFTFDDVAQSISDKLEARHPHIFGDEDGKQRSQTERWETLKAREREQSGATSALDGIAHALPALMRAEKIQKRVARVGFDWPDVQGPIDKLNEELDELAAANTNDARILEAGDVLFAAVNIVRAYGISPEHALKATNAKFEKRFRQMENMASSRGLSIADMTIDEMEALWVEAKRLEA